MASFTFNYDSDNTSDNESCIVYNQGDNFKIGGATTRSQTKRIKLDDQLASSSISAVDNSELSLPKISNEIASQAQPIATFGDQIGDISADQTNEPRSSPKVSTADDVVEDQPKADPLPESTQSPSPPINLEEEPLKTSSSVYDQDTIVLQNDLLEAHIYRAFHRHQKIFQ